MREISKHIRLIFTKELSIIKDVFFHCGRDSGCRSVSVQCAGMPTHLSTSARRNGARTGYKIQRRLGEVQIYGFIVLNH